MTGEFTTADTLLDKKYQPPEESSISDRDDLGESLLVDSATKTLNLCKLALHDDVKNWREVKRKLTESLDYLRWAFATSGWSLTASEIEEAGLDLEYVEGPADIRTIGLQENIERAIRIAKKGVRR